MMLVKLKSKTGAGGEAEPGTASGASRRAGPSGGSAAAGGGALRGAGLAGPRRSRSRGRRPPGERSAVRRGAD